MLRRKPESATKSASCPCLGGLSGLVQGASEWLPTTHPRARTDEYLARRSQPFALISTVTYRSRAAAPTSELDLHRLARAAQLRNSAEGVTGLLVYDQGWIFKHLEGPTDDLARIWAFIRSDRRHAAIDILSNGSTHKRDFQDWDLKLSVRGAHTGLGRLGMPDEPPEMIGRLSRGGRPADLLGVSWLVAVEKHVPPVVANEALGLYRAALSELVATVIVPRLFAARPAPEARLPPLSATLAALLIAVDVSSAFAFVEAALDRYVSLGSLATDLIEPAARDLGDLWQSDDCSEFEATLGLTRLQAIAREFGLGAPRISALHPPAVLVTPQPGEAHMLGAVLDAEMPWQAGWSPHVDFPSSSCALDTFVASTWIDALDLSRSTSFRRDHQLDQVRKTITSARLASQNPAIVVIVSGRAFSDLAKASDTAATGRHIGADLTFGSASQAQSAILQALRGPLPQDGFRSRDQRSRRLQAIAFASLKLADVRPMVIGKIIRRRLKPGPWRFVVRHAGRHLADPSTAAPPDRARTA